MLGKGGARSLASRPRALTPPTRLGSLPVVHGFRAVDQVIRAEVPPPLVVVVDCSVARAQLFSPQIETLLGSTPVSAVFLGPVYQVVELNRLLV